MNINSIKEKFCYNGISIFFTRIYLKNLELDIPVWNFAVFKP